MFRLSILQLILFTSLAWSQPVFRLPNDTIPLRYNLSIVTNVHRKELKFTGRVAIEILVLNRTDCIVLHSRKATIYEVHLRRLPAGKEVKNVKFTPRMTSANEDLLTISGEPKLKLLPGEKYQLEIRFVGEVLTGSRGFYLANYTNSKGDEIYAANTQFEPASARYVFPCYDEPAFKAKFTLSLTHGSAFAAVSNMPAILVTADTDDEMTTTVFQETPPMSTYLLAFAVGDYVNISKTVNGVEHVVYLPPDLIAKGSQALQNSITAVVLLEKLFDVKYPLPRIAHIGVKYLMGAAMENWGLIVYREMHLLDKSKPEYVWQKDFVQFHEIAHQWFGNIVSPKWWTYSWLNEGFATYFEYVLASMTHPNWDLNENFIKETYGKANGVRAISSHLQSEDDLGSVAFDEVAYVKAATVIRMIHHTMGQTFIKGLSKYLKKHSFSSADEDDLFASLQEAATEDGLKLFSQKRSVARLFKSWTHNRGRPIVSVARNLKKNTITIRQRSSVANSTELWYIPLTFATASEPDFNDTRADYVMPPVAEITLDPKTLNVSLKASDWLVANKLQSGYFHVVYDDQSWKLILEELNRNPQRIHRMNRALFSTDLAALVRLDPNSVPIDQIFDLLTYQRRESDTIVITAAHRLMSTIRSQLVLEKSLDSDVKEFFRSLVEPAYPKAVPRPMKNNPGPPEILLSACDLGVPACLEQAKLLTKSYVATRRDDIISEQQLSGVLCHGFKSMDKAEMETTLETISKLPRSDEVENIVGTLGCAENPEVQNMLLRLVFKEKGNVPYRKLIFYGFQKSVILDYATENYKTLAGNPEFSTLLKLLVKGMTTFERKNMTLTVLLEKLKSVNKTLAADVQKILEMNEEDINDEIDVDSQQFKQIMAVTVKAFQSANRLCKLEHRQQVSSQLPRVFHG